MRLVVDKEDRHTMVRMCNMEMGWKTHKCP